MFKPTKTRGVMSIECMPESLLYMRYIDGEYIKSITEWFSANHFEVSSSTMGNIIRYAITLPRYRRYLESNGYKINDDDLPKKQTDYRFWILMMPIKLAAEGCFQKRTGNVNEIFLEKSRVSSGQ